MKRKIVLNFLLITLLIISSLDAVSIHASDDEVALGSMTHYNGIVFDDVYLEQADVEGALAVGGVANMGTLGWGFCFGAAYSNGGAQSIGTYTNPNNYPTLLLGGAAKFHASAAGSHFNIYHGPMIVSHEHFQAIQQNAIINPGEIRFNSGANIWLRRSPYLRSASQNNIDAFFDHALHTIQSFQSRINNSEASGVYLNEIRMINLTDFIVFDANLNEDIIIINILDRGNIALNEIHLDDITDYNLVVINFPYANNVVVTPSALHINGELIGSHHHNIQTFSEILLWSFPTASSIRVEHHDMVGSVLAPHAHYEGIGGSTNGMLISNSFTSRGGHELHAFRPRLRDRVFEVKPEPPDDETFYDIDPDTNWPEFDYNPDLDINDDLDGMMPEIDPGDYCTVESEDGDYIIIDCDLKTYMPTFPEYHTPELEQETVAPEIEIENEKRLPQTNSSSPNFWCVGVVAITAGTVLATKKRNSFNH